MCPHFHFAKPRALLASAPMALGPPFLAVLTCPRPGIEYASETMRLLDEAGGKAFPGPRLLFSDGPLDRAVSVPRGWRKRAFKVNKGAIRGVWKIIELALAADASSLLFFEDDVTVCRNAVTRMQRFVVPKDVALASFYDGNEVKEGAKPKLHRRKPLGWHGRGMWGTLGLKIPRRTLEFLRVNDPDRLKYYHRNAADEFIGQLTHLSPWPCIGYHVPNLVEHRGATSIVHPGAQLMPHRTANNFPGESFDALSLPVFR